MDDAGPGRTDRGRLGEVGRMKPSCHGETVTARDRRRWVHACVSTS
ncbi:hypothetical protein [Ornithinimicrobium kibberense]